MIALALTAFLSISVPQDTLRMTLEDALARARRANPEYQRDVLDHDNEYLSWLGARAERFLPEVGVQLTTPEYVSALRRVQEDDGSDRFVRTLRRAIEGELEITQPLPTGGTFRISGTLTSLNQPLDDPDERFQGASFLGFQLSQDFFGINGRRRSYRLARESYVRAQTEFLETERELANNVIEQYYDLVQAIKEAQIDSVVFVRDSIRSASRGAGQVVTQLDSLKFALEAAQSALSRTESRQDLARNRVQFNESMGLAMGTVVVPDTVVRIERIVADPRQGLEYAMANRLDLKLSQLSVENRRAGLKDARKTSPITVDLDGTIGFDGSAENIAFRPALSNALRSQDRSTSIQVTVTIPLFDRFEERYSVAEASNDLKMAELSLAEQLIELENEVLLASQDVAIALARLELAEQSFSITRQTLQIQTDRFARNEIGLTEFLIDQNDAREAEVDLLEAQVEVLQANEEWKRAIGVPPFQGAAIPPGSAAPGRPRPDPRVSRMLLRRK